MSNENVKTLIQNLSCLLRNEILPDGSNILVGLPEDIAFEKFDETKEKFSSYRRRLEDFFECCKLAEQGKTKCFLNSIGEKWRTMIRSTCSQGRPIENNSYSSLVVLFEQLILPKKNNVLVEQDRFFNRYQRQFENIVEYIKVLKAMSLRCEFVCTTNKCGAWFGNICLRSQFIRGLREPSIRDALLLKEDLTFTRAAEIALLMEQKIADQALSRSAISESKRSRPRSPRGRVTILETRLFRGRSPCENSERRRSRGRISQEIACSTISEHRRILHGARSPALHGSHQFERNRSNSRGRFVQPFSKTSNDERYISYRDYFRMLGIEGLCIQCGAHGHKKKECSVDPDNLVCSSCGACGHVTRVCCFWKAWKGRNEYCNSRKSKVEEW